eukprot:TRINITY_DN20232_c0_g1::TRINITY_DN20232_c0_g1_i1::g.30386::m.30386 TRINITY_DN20232_c0_g1::TRINITY_DN20232_c0_g1_i1::g.30386  ORF type:complete len:318 (+),score=54.23,sp/Q96DB5/RMD1_HUMAN/42.52/4e-72,TPR_19/PF14559.1/1.1e+02,TPR_19/PF14559.1/0.045,TPR_19/PF14559.1/0.00026,TPR_16/PF13432.1/30,TPR_16/PF13432.1/0.041,TPR_16/PF13432.1/1.4e+03,TPR_16/PF13432.1/0.065,TPR_17/PF13431.1/1.8e+03,TPR_17/PF13431.1/0.019,TPR_17/PF13431.1/1.6e+03,TPR_17/PF13431.1/5.1,TPR_8/PF13181.1/1.1e+04,TPR_8/PF13181.1/1.1
MSRVLASALVSRAHAFRQISTSSVIHSYSAKFTASRTIPAFLLLALPLVNVASCEQPKTGKLDVKVVIQKADQLYDENNTQRLYELLEEHYQQQGEATDAEVLWRLARAVRDMADNTKSLSAEEKKHYIYRALALARQAVDKDPTNFAAHKWYAICLSRVGDYEGNKAKILNAFKIREHFDHAARLNPRDATTEHLIGLWCWTLAEMSWIEKKGAAALFAQPPESSYEEALEHLMRAETIEPLFYSKNSLYLGKVLLRLGRKDEAKKYLMEAVNAKVNNLDDESAVNEAKGLLSKMK